MEELSCLNISWKVENITDNELRQKVIQNFTHRQVDPVSNVSNLFAATTIQPQVSLPQVNTPLANNAENKEEKIEVKKEEPQLINYTKEEKRKIITQYRNIETPKFRWFEDRVISTQCFKYHVTNVKTSDTKGRINLCLPRDSYVAQLSIMNAMIILDNFMQLNSKDNPISSIKHEVFIKGNSPIPDFDYLCSKSHMIETNQLTLYFIKETTESEIIDCLKILNEFFKTRYLLPPNPNKDSDTTLKGYEYVSYRHVYTCKEFDLSKNDIDTDKLYRLLKQSKHSPIYQEKIIEVVEKHCILPVNKTKQELTKYELVFFTNNTKKYSPEVREDLISIVNQCMIKPAKLTLAIV